MNRRGMFRALLGAGPALAVAKAAHADSFHSVAETNRQLNRAIRKMQQGTYELLHPENHELKDGCLFYRGYRLLWTGWKAQQDSPDLVAQMVAFWKDHGRGLYVSNPGGWGPYQRGYHFDVAYRFPQVLTSTASPSDLVAVRHQMGVALHALIDYVADKGMQENSDSRWWYQEPLRIHPELKNYFGWVRLPDALRDQWREEEWRSQNRSV